MEKKQTKILITGKNGQLGQHLIKFFQENYPTYILIGTARHKSYEKQPTIFDNNKIITELLDLCDVISVEDCIKNHKPDYIFNTAANAFVGESWKVPYQHLQVNTVGVLNILESIKKFSLESKFLNLGTSEEFACTIEQGKTKQTEETKISPKSPYAVSKASARFLIDVYKESFGLFAVQPWVFNFESKLRGEKYFTRKVTKGVARIFNAIKENRTFEPIQLGNLKSYRSWQHAKDVVDGLWKIINQENALKPYVLSENKTHKIKEFVEKSFLVANIEGHWEGENLEEIFLAKNGDILVAVNPEFFRPSDVTYLSGDSSLIRKELGWEPKISFDELVEEMVLNDIAELKS